jgi:hypothetical protein
MKDLRPNQPQARDDLQLHAPAHHRTQLPHAEEAFFEYLAGLDCSALRVFALRDGTVRAGTAKRRVGSIVPQMRSRALTWRRTDPSG